MRKIAFHTLGCKVNIYETEAMQQLMLEAGYQVVDFEDIADIYVINTCSVTNMADKKSRQMLHKARRENPKSLIVAAGCYVQSAAQKLRDSEDVDIIIGNNLKKDIAKILNAYYDESSQEVITESIPEVLRSKKQSHLIDIHRTKEFEEFQVATLGGHTRAFIKIQDGCNQFCTYCIIPFTRGRVRSRKVEEVLKEVESMTLKGYQEIVLTGIHLSSYGIDFKDEEVDTLLKLTQEIAKIEEVRRIRLGSLEPRVITEEFLLGLRKIPQFCPHFHLSLQSGSDTVLQRMSRRYTSEEFIQGVNRIRSIFPYAAITTDVIVGFPEETEEEFWESLNFVEKIGFYEMHIFPYSQREGTKAAMMQNILTKAEKSKRAKKMAELEKQMSKEYRNLWIGKEVEVLLEEEQEIYGKKYMVGYTREYIKIALSTISNSDKNRNLLRNSIIKGRIQGFITEEIMSLEEIEI